MKSTQVQFEILSKEIYQAKVRKLNAENNLYIAQMNLIDRNERLEIALEKMKSLCEDFPELEYQF